MTRITSYNILAGGYNALPSGYTQRTQQLISIIRSTQSDVVGLIEATNSYVTRRPFVIEQIAESLDMQLIMADHSFHTPSSPYYPPQYQPALMTRLPIIYKKIHAQSHVLPRPLLEVCVEERNGEHLILFVTHLSASFNEGWAGSSLRNQELREILRIMAQVKDRPHVLMGDFNSLAPGDDFKASYLLRYITQLDEQRQKRHRHEGLPQLDGIVPNRLRFLNPLLRTIARHRMLSSAFDMAASLYAPRSTITMMQQAGYVDCYRRIHPHATGFTCPSAAPAGRIDFIFASPLLAKRLETCYPVTDGEGVSGQLASDHLAVFAEFRELAGELQGEIAGKLHRELTREGAVMPLPLLLVLY